MPLSAHGRVAVDRFTARTADEHPRLDELPPIDLTGFRTVFGVLMIWAHFRTGTNIVFDISEDMETWEEVSGIDLGYSLDKDIYTFELINPVVRGFRLRPTRAPQGSGFLIYIPNDSYNQPPLAAAPELTIDLSAL